MVVVVLSVFVEPCSKLFDDEVEVEVEAEADDEDEDDEDGCW